ncbi:hypothetical protein [Terriglobus sp.]|uniref:hypothetical protein n=1 Tax=Terriglobus sp. TaxID=1889013 RepID=UPI003AFFEDD5
MTTKTLKLSKQFASPRQFGWLAAGIACAAVLMGAEVAHYVIQTDLGAIDQMEASANVDPRCKPLGGSKYDFSCPFPGYNSVQMTCMLRGCGDRNLSMPPTTDDLRTKMSAMEQADSTTSLSVEEPYSGNDADWREMARVLHAGKEWSPKHAGFHGTPRTMEEVQQLIQQRSQIVLRETAQEWLNQHGR